MHILMFNLSVCFFSYMGFKFQNLYSSICIHEERKLKHCYKNRNNTSKQTNTCERHQQFLKFAIVLKLKQNIGIQSHTTNAPTSARSGLSAHM